MKKRVILLLGGNKLNYGILKKFQEKGFKVYVVDWNEFPQMEGDKHYRIDVKDYMRIIEELKKDGEWKYVVFAYSSIDLAVKSVAMINREIGLKTISDEGLKYASSKSRMTKKWNEKGILNRISLSFSVYDNSIFAINSHKTIIIKPDDSASSRGITIVPIGSSENIIKEAFEKALRESNNNIVVVEEFVEGIEFTIDMLGDAYGNVSVYGISKKTHTKFVDNNKIAVKLHYNSISEELQKKLAEVGVKCYKTLGFSASLGHLEVLLKEDGSISPVEIGARSSGFIASDLVDIVSGADYLMDLIDVQKGQEIVSGLHSQTEKSSMYYFYDIPDGVSVKKECSLLDFCDASIVSRYNDRASIKIGKKFSKIDNDNARWGYEILEGPKEVMTEEYIKTVERRMIEYMLEEN